MPQLHLAHPRRWTVLLVGAVASLFMASTAYFALGGFTATITNSQNTFASGTILLQENQASTTCLSTSSSTISTNSNPCPTINLMGSTNAVPGTSNTVTVSFKNIGSVNASTFTLTPAACAAAANSATSPYAGSDTAGFCGKVDVTIANTTVPASPVCVYPVETGACPAVSSGYTLASLGSSGSVTLGAVSAGATDTFVITSELDPSATNADQGLAASESLAWELAQ